MTTVIEVFDLLETGKYEGVSKEKRFENLIKAFFVSDDVKSETNKTVVRGTVIYKVDLSLTVRHEELMRPLTYSDIAMMLCHFCKTLRILRDDGVELAFYTDTN